MGIRSSRGFGRYGRIVALAGALAAGGGPLRAAGPPEAVVEVRSRSGPTGPLRELAVRGGGAVRFTASVRQGGGGDRARIGIAAPVPGGMLHAGALRGARAGVTPLRAGSPFGAWRAAPPATSTAGSAEGVAWVRLREGLVWSRGAAEPSSVTAWLARGGVRLAGRTGPDPAARLDVRTARVARLSLHLRREAWAGRAALVGPAAALAVERAAGWRARLGLRGEAAGGRWQADGVVAWVFPAHSDLAAEWIRRAAGRELRLAARVNREGGAVRGSGAARFELALGRGAAVRLGFVRARGGAREAAFGLEWRRRDWRLLGELSLPERAGRRLDLRLGAGGGQVRVRGRARIQRGRGPEVEVALVRRFALTSPGERDTMRPFGHPLEEAAD